MSTHIGMYVNAKEHVTIGLCIRVSVSENANKWTGIEQVHGVLCISYSYGISLDKVLKIILYIRFLKNQTFHDSCILFVEYQKNCT